MVCEELQLRRGNVLGVTSSARPSQTVSPFGDRRGDESVRNQISAPVVDNTLISQRNRVMSAADALVRRRKSSLSFG